MNNYLLWENTKRNETFSDFVCLKIRKRQLNEVALYKSVDLSRDIFSKIFSNRFYRPSKQTAMKFWLWLKLNLTETDYWSSLAGYALSTNLKEDLVVRFCILNGIYNLLKWTNCFMNIAKLLYNNKSAPNGSDFISS